LNLLHGRRLAHKRHELPDCTALHPLTPKSPAHLMSKIGHRVHKLVLLHR
jgi:hypothetical protein